MQHSGSRGGFRGERVNSRRGAYASESRKKRVEVPDIELSRQQKASELMMVDGMSAEEAISKAWEEFPDPDEGREPASD